MGGTADDSDESTTIVSYNPLGDAGAPGGCPSGLSGFRIDRWWRGIVGIIAFASSGVVALFCAVRWTTQWPSRGLRAAAQPALSEVLIVIDMQKDYDITANMELYGRVRSPFVGNISSIVPGINDVRAARHWDLVVFTQDWLYLDGWSELYPGLGHFCVAGTPGAGILDSLQTSPHDLHFSKNLDDAFNTDKNVWTAAPKVVASHEPPRRGYGLRNEGSRIGAGSNNLAGILAKLGYRTGDTRLTFVGQMTDRCVMKSALHARDLGFEATVVTDVVYTSDTAPVDWRESPPRDLQRADARWVERIYQDRLGAAGPSFAFDYMRAAGVHLVARHSLLLPP